MSVRKNYWQPPGEKNTLNNWNGEDNKQLKHRLLQEHKEQDAQLKQGLADRTTKTAVSAAI